ncbi:hypothetical protein [Burkholderia pyrrocinia]
MNHLNKLILLYAMSIAAPSAFAGNALLFQDPHLVAYNDNGRITGVYSSIGNTQSCYFLFYGTLTGGSPDKNGYASSKIETFLPGDKILDFSNRAEGFDISGKLYSDDSDWIIRTDHPQAGCASAQGVFEFDPPDYRAKNYSIDSTIPALGIRLIKDKSILYDFKDGKFLARKGYLTKWDGVVVIKTTKDGFSYVRYVDAGPKHDGRVTFGWIHTSDLVDPFPPPTK